MVDRSLCFISLPSYGYFVPERFDKTGGGGAKRQIHLLSQELSENVDVHVVVGDYGQPKTETVEGISLHRSYTPNEGGKIGNFYQLYSAMRQADADIYIYRGNPRKIGFIGVIAWWLGAEWVYNVANDADLQHHYDRMGHLEKQVVNWSLQNSRTIIVQTKRQQDLLQDRFGLHSVLVSNGYAPSDTISDNGEYFLWVGRLNEQQKRPHLLLECAKRLPRQEFKIIGPKDQSEYTSELLGSINELSNIEYLGAVSPNKIGKYFSRAIALVNTSAYEGFPNTFLEAWRCEVPVVSLDVDPGRYLDDQCFSGYANGDIDHLCSLLDQLANDEDYRDKVGRTLRQYFEDEYTIESVAQDYLGAINSPQHE